MKRKLCMILAALLASGSLLSCASGGVENGDAPEAGQTPGVTDAADASPAPETAPETEEALPASSAEKTAT